MRNLENPGNVRLLAAISLRSPFGARDHALIRFDLLTGLRVGQLVALHVQGKGGHPRQQPLGPRLLDRLQTYLAEVRPELKPRTQALFPNDRGEALSGHAIAERMRTYSSGLITIHAVRHAFATHLLTNGAPVWAVQKLLGHQVIDSTAHYTHLLPADIETVLRGTHPRHGKRERKPEEYGREACPGSSFFLSWLPPAGPFSRSKILPQKTRCTAKNRLRAITCAIATMIRSWAVFCSETPSGWRVAQHACVLRRGCDLQGGSERAENGCRAEMQADTARQRAEKKDAEWKAYLARVGSTGAVIPAGQPGWVIGGVAGKGISAAAGFVLGRVGGAAAQLSTSEGVANGVGYSVEERVVELGAAIPDNVQGRISMGVGLAQDAAGNPQIFMSTSEPRGYLRPGVVLREGETMVSGTGHAEMDLVNYAKANGLRLLQIGATRPVCKGSTTGIAAQSDALIITPIKPWR